MLTDPIIFDDPVKLSEPDSWAGHIPFAFWLIKECKPDVFVELGTHTGNSYFAFCQAVKEAGIKTKCFAIDTWEGDKHAGFYDDIIFNNVNQHNKEHYSKFSILYRTLFDDAIGEFADDSIDLLHIDGFHTYEAVKHDFETWLSKMSDKGVVILHDVCVKKDNFGAWKFWEEIKNNYPSFLFEHSNGLGILAVGNNVPGKILELIDMNDPQAEYIKKMFDKLGSLLTGKMIQERMKNIINSKDTHINNIEAEINLKDTHINNIESELNLLKQSKIWRASEFVKKIIYQKLLGRTPLLQRSLVTLSSEGLCPFITKVKKYLTSNRVAVLIGLGIIDYDAWIDINKITRGEERKIESDIALLKYKPKISIIMPVYNVDKKWLVKAIESVINQLYDNWELCIADDESTKKHIRKVLDYYSKEEKRIKVKYLKDNMGISGASNAALSLATGEFIGMLDHDDELSIDALYEVVKLLNKDQGIDFIYSDEDKITEKGKRKDPFFKPDWSPDMLRSCNYICHFTVLRKKIVDLVGGFRKGYEGSQDYDLFLRCSEKVNKIVHIPKILYHWRIIDGSAAQDPGAKTYAFKSAKRALADHIKRIGLDGSVQDGFFLGSYRIQYPIEYDSDVTIIIPTKDKVEVLKRCIDSILQKSTYKKYSILVVDNASIEQRTFLYYDKLKRYKNISILKYDLPFNFSAINNYAVERVDSEYIVFLNNDTEIISPCWIESMLEFVQRRDVGAAGGLLYYPNDTVQHAGVILGIGGVASHSHKYFHKDAYGYCGRLKISQNFSAVTAACMMVKKTIFKEVGGFDEYYAYAFNDIDLCLKIREKGYLIVYTPYAELYHHESISRGYEDTEEKIKRFNNEVDRFQKKWGDLLSKGDPYYNPNLTLEREDCSIKLC